MNFASDNTAGIAPEILQALVSGNDGFALGYGNDDVTREVERRIGEIFERDVAVFLVPTGTAANALALAHVSPLWGAVFAHSEAHILIDECGAPEFFGGGLKLVGMPGVGCKIAPETLASTVSHYLGHAPHQVVPAAFSFAQASEAGTIYRPGEIAGLTKIAHEHGMKVHMDGARFANAVAGLNVSPAEITWKSGVDALSFGATKNGAMMLEGDSVEDGKPARNRITWTDRPDATVRQLWEISTDNGKSWKTLFDGTYRPAKAPRTNNVSGRAWPGPVPQ